ncbi:MAG: SRPBCC domain-containing protein [Bdellovibrionota bacterium]
MNEKIIIRAEISAPLSEVWIKYTDSSHITQWNFASEDWHCPRASTDLRTGGKYFARMEAKDGSFGFDLNAIYQEVTHQSKIIMILEDKREVVTEFREIRDKTEVETQFDAENQNPVEMQKNGWQSILNQFKTYVEKQ